MLSLSLSLSVSFVLSVPFLFLSLPISRCVSQYLPAPTWQGGGWWMCVDVVGLVRKHVDVLRSPRTPQSRHVSLCRRQSRAYVLIWVAQYFISLTKLGAFGKRCLPVPCRVLNQFKFTWTRCGSELLDVHLLSLCRQSRTFLSLFY